MIQNSFTAKELFTMAYLLKKQKMYGLPYEMGKKQHEEMQLVIDELLTQGIVQMDMDGNIEVLPAYGDLVNIYCDCNKCLTINVRKEDMTTQSLIFWVYNNTCFMAECVDDHYIFSPIDDFIVKATIVDLLCTVDADILSEPVVIPQISVIKAKRACTKGKYNDAIQIIRQCGASSDVCNAIVSGLEERAYYFGLVYMDIHTGVCDKKELTYLCTNKILLSLEQTTVNFRTCAVFTPIDCHDMHNAVNTYVNEFMSKED